MTDIQAAVGREQLKRLPEIIERRRVAGSAIFSIACRNSRRGAAGGTIMGPEQLAKFLRSAYLTNATSGR